MTEQLTTGGSAFSVALSMLSSLLIKAPECGVWSGPSGPVYLLAVAASLVPFYHVRLLRAKQVLTSIFFCFLITAFARYARH